MIAVIHGGVKKNNTGALFSSGEFLLQGWMTIDCWNKVER